MIPPAEPGDLKAYATALATPTLSPDEKQQADNLAAAAADRITTRAAAREIVAKIQASKP